MILMLIKCVCSQAVLVVSEPVYSDELSPTLSEDLEHELVDRE